MPVGCLIGPERMVGYATRQLKQGEKSTAVGSAGGIDRQESEVLNLIPPPSKFDRCCTEMLLTQWNTLTGVSIFQVG